jgi:hypothetical protein
MFGYVKMFGNFTVTLMYSFTIKSQIMFKNRYIAYGLFLIFALAVMPIHSFAQDNAKYPGSGSVAKAKVFGIDQLFVCTADVPTIFVNAWIPYAPAKNAIVVAPIKLVAATSNSPPANRC